MTSGAESHDRTFFADGVGFTMRWNAFFEGALAALFFALVTIDLAAASFPHLGRSGFYLWISALVPLALIAAVELGRLLIEGINKFAMLTPVALLVFSLWLAHSLTDLEPISSETIEQIFCATKQMNGATAGFRDTCFLDYPTRGYFLIALPAYFFGHSFAMLGFGYAVFLFMSLVLFVGGLQRYLTSLQIPSRHIDLCVVIGLLLCLHINPVHEILTYFEQIQLPLAYGFIITGLALRFVCTREVSIAWILGIVLLQAIFVYTPAMLVIPAGICFFLLVAISNRFQISDRLTAGAIVAGTLTTLGSSYLVFGSRNISSFVSHHDVPKLMLDQVAVALLFPIEQPAVFTIFSQAFFSAAFVAAFAGLLGREVFLCSLWIIAGAAFSVLGGYSEWPVPYSMYRMAAGFPVWAVIVVIGIQKIGQRLRSGSVALGAVGLFLCVALLLGEKGFGRQRQDDRIPLAAIAKRLDADPTTGPLHGVAVSDDVVEFVPAMQWFDQILRHVLPDVRVIRGCGQIVTQKTLVLTRSGGLCSKKLAGEAPKIEQYSNGKISIELLVLGTSPLS